MAIDSGYTFWYIIFCDCLLFKKVCKSEETTMIDLYDVNVKMIIATSLMLIVVLLVYIAFFKESKTTRSSRK